MTFIYRHEDLRKEKMTEKRKKIERQKKEK